MYKVIIINIDLLIQMTSLLYPKLNALAVYKPDSNYIIISSHDIDIHTFPFKL